LPNGAPQRPAAPPSSCRRRSASTSFCSCDGKVGPRNVEAIAAVEAAVRQSRRPAAWALRSCRSRARAVREAPRRALSDHAARRYGAIRARSAPISRRRSRSRSVFRAHDTRMSPTSIACIAINVQAQPTSDTSPMEAEPEALRTAKYRPRPQIRIRGDRSCAAHDLVDPSRRHTDRAREAILRQAHRLDELQQQNLSGGGIGNLLGGNRRYRHGRDLLSSRRSKAQVHRRSDRRTDPVSIDGNAITDYNGSTSRQAAPFQ
jgi:hypothetical protein